MNKRFVKLTVGVATIDHSLGYSTKRFKIDSNPVYIRPYLIESFQRIEWGDGHDFTQVSVAGTDNLLSAVETPREIEAMIEAIEFSLPNIEQKIDEPSVRKATNNCLHENIASGNNGARDYCTACGKEFD